MSKKQRQKNISMDEDLLTQIEALCTVLHTNFTNKTKELLVNWKIEELNRLKAIAPELHDAYQKELLKASKEVTS
mgnify:CR=1 FL=1